MKAPATTAPAVTATTIKALKIGDWFTLKPIEEPTHKQVYIRGEYDRGSKRFACQSFDDISKYRYLKGDRVVYTDFTF